MRFVAAARFGRSFGAGHLVLARAHGLPEPIGLQYAYSLIDRGTELDILPAGQALGMGLVALVANVACLVMVAKKKDAGAHMKASYIFSANDVIANAGVIAAGALVAFTGSRYPDLLIGAIVGLVVLNGARQILRLGRS